MKPATDVDQSALGDEISFWLSNLNLTHSALEHSLFCEKIITHVFNEIKEKNMSRKCILYLFTYFTGE